METPRLSLLVVMFLKNVTWFKALCAGGGNVTFWGYHIWLQSDAAFVYPRLDSTALSVGMLWAT